MMLIVLNDHNCTGKEIIHFCCGPTKSGQVTSQDDRNRKDYIDEGRQLLILYGTEYGCSEEVARLLYDKIDALNDKDEEYPLQPRLLNVRDFKLIDWTHEQICFVVISTSGDGVPPTDAIDFYNYLQNTDVVEIREMRFSVLALGDSNYPQFCKVGHTLHERLVTLGGECVVSLTDVDMEDWTVIKSWLDRVTAYLTTAHINPSVDYIRHGDITEDNCSRKTPFVATLKVKRQLTVVETPMDKETVHCEFDVTGSELTWLPGDAVGIYPENNRAEVCCLVLAMKCTGNELGPLPASAYKTQGTPAGDQCLSSVLQKYYDLKSVKPDLLLTLKDHLGNSQEAGKLELLLRDEISKKNTRLYGYLEPREVVDVLEDFPSHTLPWQHILPCLKALQPRYYSIASSPKVDKNTICVTAAVVRYETLGRPRTGVTTTYLQDRLEVGGHCPMFISHNPGFQPPACRSIPIIMIGPGTGIAPFIAFIQERAIEKVSKSSDESFGSGRTLLYFGCRHRDRDYLHREHLEAWSSSGVLELRVAFSRDQAHKVYVQHLLHDDGAQIWALLEKEKAHLYVCGDAKHMAHDVHTTLLDIVQGQGHMTREEAEMYLTDLEASEQYQKDVWVV
ncbi:NADPH oxidoreductase A-like isoform X2 [Mya arenaria]|uniref:NADPH oxidoreductase A-like isoform X2 n=1 Tax=Mya arenaria TaxID=6604 RepID=UPI0022E60E2D|nr:NADPH oxidoreductase A-like isoform X2 [Mya arenaria]